MLNLILALALLFAPPIGPAVTSVSPNWSGDYGWQQVTIKGNRFANPNAGVTHVFFGPYESITDAELQGYGPRVINNKTITCYTHWTPQDIPGNILSVDIVVVNNGGASTPLSGAFQYEATPRVLSCTPMRVSESGGQTVVLACRGLEGHDTVLDVEFEYDISAPFWARTGLEEITCILPAIVATGEHAVDAFVNVYLEMSIYGDSYPSGPVLEIVSDVWPWLDALDTVSPTSTSASGGATIQLHGKNFLHAGAGATSVSIARVFPYNPYASPVVNVISDTLIEFECPAAQPDAYSVKVSNALGAYVLVYDEMVSPLVLN